MGLDDQKTGTYYPQLNQLKTETRKVYTGSSTTPTTTTVVTYVIDTAGNISSVETKVNDVVTDTVEYTYGNAYWSDRLTAITVNGTSKNISYATYLNPSSWYNGTQFTNLTWTQGRRLSSITEGSQTYSYEYDMAGIRTSKVANGLKHEYVTQSGRIVREIVTNASTGAFQYALDFTYDEAGHPLTMRKYNNADMQTNYITMQYVCNAQGDVVKLIYNGTVYAEYTYDAWGNVLTATENGSYNYAALNPLRYRGYYYDSETGFYYLQSRYYDPIVKRFLNADSYASTGQGFLGYNMFAYCNNTPVCAKDSSGHQKCSDVENMLFAYAFAGAFYAFASMSDNNSDAFRKAVGSVTNFFQQILHYTAQCTLCAGDINDDVINRVIPKIDKNKQYQSPYELHHIVAQSAFDAAPARIILDFLGIDINSSCNTVLLKTALHRRLHNALYYQTVNSIVITAVISSNGNIEEARKNVTLALSELNLSLLSLNLLCP